LTLAGVASIHVLDKASWTEPATVDRLTYVFLLVGLYLRGGVAHTDGAPIWAKLEAELAKSPAKRFVAAVDV